jgi:hypothetical protein
MRVTVEDLEALKELNDELEENHVETERSLHEEIGIFRGYWTSGCVVDFNVQNRGIPKSENLTPGSNL